MPRQVRIFACCIASILLMDAGPPPTLKVDHVETLYGITVHDPYYWMEAGGRPFEQWASVQAAYTRQQLMAIPGRTELLHQIQALNSHETRVDAVLLAGEKWIYSKTGPTDSVAKIYERAMNDSTEHVLIDPTMFDANGQAAQIDFWNVSPNAQYVAYGISLGGSEIGTMRIRSLITGADLPEQIDRVRYAIPSWIDGNSFLYTRLPEPEPGVAQSISGGQVYLHYLGRDAASDILVFGPQSVSGKDLARKFFFRVQAAPDSPVIVGMYDAGLSNSAKAVFVARKAELPSSLVWRKVVGPENDIRQVVLHRDSLYLRTARRIIRTSATSPDVRTAALVVADSAGTIDGMVAASDALYVRRNEGGLGRLLRVPWGGAPQQVATPFEGSFDALTPAVSAAGVMLCMESYTHSQTVFGYDPTSRRLIDTGIVPPSPVSFGNIKWSEVRVRASDGMSIPLSILSPGMANSGKHPPVLMYAYGAYGVTLDARFNPLRRAWFDYGGVYVIVHVRGSGGFGEEWYHAGRLENKPNSVSDFIDAAKYLIRTGWATPATLSAMGASAGGIVIGGAIVARPELFDAAVIDVGLVNTLRLEQIPIGPFNTEEFGSTETEEGARMLYAIDPYHQLREGVSYPATMISTGLNDTRVSPWMPAKFAARLQAATTGPRPVLLRVEESGGHFGADKEQIEADLADTYAFLLWQARAIGFRASP